MSARVWAFRPVTFPRIFRGSPLRRGGRRGAFGALLNRMARRAAQHVPGTVVKDTRPLRGRPHRGRSQAGGRGGWSLSLPERRREQVRSDMMSGDSHELPGGRSCPPRSTSWSPSSSSSGRGYVPWTNSSRTLTRCRPRSPRSKHRPAHPITGSPAWPVLAVRSRTPSTGSPETVRHWPRPPENFGKIGQGLNSLAEDFVRVADESLGHAAVPACGASTAAASTATGSRRARPPGRSTNSSPRRPAPRRLRPQPGSTCWDRPESKRELANYVLSTVVERTKYIKKILGSATRAKKNRMTRSAMNSTAEPRKANRDGQFAPLARHCRTELSYRCRCPPWSVVSGTVTGNVRWERPESSSPARSAASRVTRKRYPSSGPSQATTGLRPDRNLPCRVHQIRLPGGSIRALTSVTRRRPGKLFEDGRSSNTRRYTIVDSHQGRERTVPDHPITVWPDLVVGPRDFVVAVPDMEPARSVATPQLAEYFFGCLKRTNVVLSLENGVASTELRKRRFDGPTALRATDAFIDLAAIYQATSGRDVQAPAWPRTVDRTAVEPVGSHDICLIGHFRPNCRCRGGAKRARRAGNKGSPGPRSPGTRKSYYLLVVRLGVVRRTGVRVPGKVDRRMWRDTVRSRVAAGCGCLLLLGGLVSVHNALLVSPGELARPTRYPTPAPVALRARSVRGSTMCNRLPLGLSREISHEHRRYGFACLVDVHAGRQNGVHAADSAQRVAILDGKEKAVIALQMALRTCCPP